MAQIALDPAAAWEGALEALRRQMTRISYDENLHGVTVMEVAPPTWTVAARSEENREFLALRLADKIALALAGLVGYEPELRFVVAAPARPQVYQLPPPETAMVANTAELVNSIGDEADLSLPGSLLSHLDYEQGWFGNQSPGYDRMLKYWGHFWRAYLSRRNAVAYTLWEYLQVADKRNVNAAGFTWWTPAKKYNVRPLARVLGCAPVTVSGGFRQCSIFNAALAGGQELDECCQAYSPHLMNETRTGTPQCIHWVKGAFEVLYEEGLLAIQTVTGAPKSSYCVLQVWRLLPLLTPSQVATMHEVEQLLHESWLEQNGYKIGCAPVQWNEERALRVVAGMPRREAGRVVWDSYQPNPLLPGYTGSDRPIIAPLESNSNGHEDAIAPLESNSLLSEPDA